MKSLSAIILFFLFLTKFTFAQNFKPGYIVLTNKDTLKGYIRDDDWERSPEKIQFMQNTNTQPIEYTTKHVKEFSVNQNIYESYFVSVNKKSIEVKDLT